MSKFSIAPFFRHGILGLLNDQIEGDQLEYRYESDRRRRRLFSMAFAALCLLEAYLVARRRIQDRLAAR
jgi:hypothetical protein